MDMAYLTNRELQYAVVTIEILPLEAYGNYRVQITNQEDESIGTRYLNTVVYLGELASSVDRFCKAAHPLLICGEPGCGKSTAARMLYYKSQYHKKPLYSIDFSIPQN